MKTFPLLVCLLAAVAFAPAYSQVSQDCVLDLVFVLDSSGSIRDQNINGQPDNWATMLQFISDLSANFNVGPSGTRVGAVRYSNEGDNQFYLDTYTSLSDISTHVLRMPYLGANTNTSGGLYKMYSEQFVTQRGDRSNVPNVCIVLTDGESTYDKALTIPMAEEARRRGIQIFVVGVTNRVNEAEVRGISSLPQIKDQNYFTADTFAALSTIVNIISQQTCRAAGTPAPPAPTPAPFTPAPALPECANIVADMVFVVDSSGSIRDKNPPGGNPDNFDLMKSFISDMVDALVIGPFNVQIGLVDYSDFASSIFFLNSFSNSFDIKNTVNSIPYFGLGTNTSGGLRVMLNDQFQSFRGDRSNARNYAIVLTDGESTIDSQRTISDAITARNGGVQIFSIGITNSVREDELRDISSLPQRLYETYWIAQTFAELNNIVQLIASTICRFQPPAPATAAPTQAPAIPGFPGPPGPQGSPGFQGPPGSPGNDGQVGFPGSAGSPGSPGFQGPPGTAGFTGPQGPPGSPGFQGPPGQNGFPGSTGSTGQPGPTGFGQPGNPGPSGFPGNTGATGQPGPSGQPGSPGFQGPSGPIGQPGSNGSPGQPGVAGFPGSTGATGFSGRDGSPGQNGFPGNTGATGRSGPSGPAGQPGQPGNQGQNGFPGSTGATGGRGNPGPQGNPGTSGRTGATGQQGFPGGPGATGPFGPSGPSGNPGSQGFQGPPGPLGNPGPSGPIGQPGLRGPSGNTGATGRDGQPGRTGSTGFIGANGRTGSTGFPGPTGLTGATGARGTSGRSGATGLRGPQGATGFNGPVGQPGFTGSQGRTGATGSLGPRGFAGPAGPEGRSGRTGATGFSGPIGQPGPQGVGRTGSTGFTGPRGFPGSTGSTGGQGRTGATGFQGPLGQPGPSGPQGGPGQPGIAGPGGRTGSTGSTGFPGPQGNPGPSGFPGRTGSTGFAGPTGPQGNPGPFGPAGRTGATGGAGPSGPSGNPGPQGFQGNPGATGFPGGQGPQGNPGPSGPQGFSGRTGATGIGGPPGPLGPSGPDGRPGPSGPSGQPGFQGPSGPLGNPGRTGATGQPGGPGGPGNPGPAGPQGFQGGTGFPGAAGRTGSTGFPGSPGNPGAQGFQGPAGPGGRSGATGSPGPLGFPGATGLSGPSGPAGFPGPGGPRGNPGPSGPAGLSGRTGATGNSGQPGFQGPPGPSGNPGSPGVSGRSGNTGATGQSGQQGFQGPPGPSGNPGPSGFPGSTGQPGPQGFQGPPGPLGSSGRTGATGNPGFQGSPGPSGERGFPGNPGPQGPSGLAGPGGLPGPTGRTGATGSRGFNGNAGATGPAGNPGFPGQPGNRGPSGNTGSTGQSGQPGFPGSAGAPGAPGIGRTGASGFPGSPGSQGPQGPPGNPGSNGQPGFPGSNGAPGRTGASGSPGAPGFGQPGPPGSEGRPGPSGQNGFPGPSGPPGQQGPQGNPGSAGSPGAPGGGCSTNDECITGNGGCQHYCVDTYDSYFCSCRDGYKVLNQAINCPGVSIPAPAPTTCSNSILDIVFVIDSSGSIRDNNPPDNSYDNWILLLDFVANLIKKLNVGRDGTHVGLVEYSNFANSLFFLNTYESEAQIMQAVRDAPYIGGFTNTSGGLRVMTFEQFTGGRGDRPNVPNVAIVITDGQANTDESRTIPDAQVAQSRGIQMFSVGVTSAVDLNELRGLSSPPQERDRNYYESDDFTQLDRLSTNLISQTCTSNGQAVPPCLNTKVDLVFLVDGSGSIRDANPSDGSIDNWDLMLTFLATLVDDLEIGSDQARIGLVRFSDKAESMWYLDTYYDHQSLRSAIRNIGYLRQMTNTSGALRVMMAEQFQSTHGDRPDAKNIAIILTDGASTLDHDRTLSDAQVARDLGIQIFTIGVTNKIDETELRLMSSPPQQMGLNYFTTPNFNELPKIRSMLIEETCLIAAQVTGDNFFCRWTAEAGYVCFCRFNECDKRPVNGSQCVNVNECQNGNNGGCQQDCFDNDGSFSCGCRSGFRLSTDRYSCDDDNECLTGNRCPFDQICVNTYGSYYCVQSNVITRFSALVGGDTALAASATSGMSSSNVAIISALAGVVAIMAAAGVILGVRRYRRGQESASPGKKWQSTGGRLFTDSGSLSYMSNIAPGSTVTIDEDAVSTSGASVSTVS